MAERAPWETAEEEAPPWGALQEVPAPQPMPPPQPVPPPPSPAQTLAAFDPSFDTELDKPPKYYSPSLGINIRPWGPWDSKEDFVSWVKAGAPFAGRDVQAGFLQSALGSIRGPGRGLEALEKSTGINVSGLPGVGPISPWLLMKTADMAKSLEDKLVAPLPEDASLARKTQRALGSSIPFLAGGMAGKVAELPAWMVPTVLGGEQGASAQYEEAVAMGADPEQALIAYAGGSATGASEGIPAGYFLNRLNKLTGGKTIEGLKELYRANQGKIPAQALKGFLIEGLQEGAQTLGENYVASDLAQYDPTRTLTENLTDNIVSGGIVGSFFGGGFGMAHRAEQRQLDRELEEIRNMKLESGNPINYVGGEFTPVESLIMLNKMKGDVDEAVATKAQAAVAEMRALGAQPGEITDAGISSDIISIQDQRPSYLGDEMAGYKYSDPVAPIYMQLRDKFVDPLIEKDLPKAADGGPLTVEEALKLSPVVAMNVDQYGLLETNLNNNIASAERALSEKREWNKILVEDLPRYIANMKDSRLEIKAKQEISKKVVGYLKDYAAAFREVLTPDLKIVITDGSHAGPIGQRGALGRFAMTGDVEIEPGKPAPVGFIFAKLDELVTSIYNNKKMAISDTTSREKRLIFEVMSHELGHAVATTNLAKWYSAAMQGDQKAMAMISMMQQEYNNWLVEATQNSVMFPVVTKHAFQYGLMKKQGLLQAGLEDRSLETWGDKDRRNYLLSFDEFFADMTARLATQGALADPVMTSYFKPVLAQYEKLFESFPEFAKAEFGQSWKQFLESQTLAYKVKEELERVTTGGQKDLFDALKGNVPGFDPKEFASDKDWHDKWNRFMELFLNLEQMVKENPHLEQWGMFKSAIEAMESYRRNFAYEVDGSIKAWRSLGKMEASKVTDVLFDEALNKKAFDLKTLSTRLNAEGLAVYQQIRQNLNMALDEMQAVATNDANKTFGGNAERLNVELASITEDFDKLRSQAYFPFIRFGKWTITARATEDLIYGGTNYKKGQLITFPVFESQRERDLATKVIREELGTKATVSPSIMKETEFQIQGMPRSILRALQRKLEATGDMTTDMRDALEGALAESTPFRNFRKHFLRKKGIHGFSLDGMRSFAEYMGRAAGHIARVKHADDIRSAMDSMQQSAEVLKLIGADATKRQQMQHWMQRTYSYLMNPTNEWASLRGLGFFFMLGGNIKSALVNSTQLPMITAPYLAARYGDTKAVASLTKATWTLKDWLSKRKEFTDAMPDETGKIVKPNDKKGRLGLMIERGKHEDWLDQSLATELAIARSERNLQRGMHFPTGKRLWYNVSKVGAFPFHMMEKMNRYITAIASYELEYEKTQDHEKSVLAAKAAVRTTQYEHARWNRPEFMRGKKSVAFLFANYIQNTLYFATRDPGAVRYWLALLFMAGLQGLPGAEDLSDLVDFAGTFLKRQLGMSNPKVDIRQEAREIIEQFGASPDLILHGISHDSFGLGKLGEVTGLPIPRFDVSGSIGMGNVLPLTEVPKAALTRSPEQTFMQAAFSAGGAGGSVLEDYYRGVMSNDPDQWKRAESVLPTSLRNVSKAVRYASRQGEKTRSGDVVAEFDPMDTRDRLELAGQALGFTPSKVSLGWEREIAIKDSIMYYKFQQEELMGQRNWAVYNEDREAESDVMDRIREYNDSVPFPEMSITGKSMKQSLRSYIEKRAVAEAGVAGEKKFQRLREKVEENYPDPWGDSLDKSQGDVP